MNVYKEFYTDPDLQDVPYNGVSKIYTKEVVVKGLRVFSLKFDHIYMYYRKRKSQVENSEKATFHGHSEPPDWTDGLGSYQWET